MRATQRGLCDRVEFLEDALPFPLAPDVAGDSADVANIYWKKV